MLPIIHLVTKLGWNTHWNLIFFPFSLEWKVHLFLKFSRLLRVKRERAYYSTHHRPFNISPYIFIWGDFFLSYSRIDTYIRPMQKKSRRQLIYVLNVQRNCLVRSFVHWLQVASLMFMLVFVVFFPTSIYGNVSTFLCIFQPN